QTRENLALSAGDGLASLLFGPDAVGHSQLDEDAAATARHLLLDPRIDTDLCGHRRSARRDEQRGQKTAAQRLRGQYYLPSGRLRRAPGPTVGESPRVILPAS